MTVKDLKKKLAKMKTAESDYEVRSKVNRVKSPLAKTVPFGKENRKPKQIREDALDKSEASTSGKKVRPKTPTQDDYARIISAKLKVNKLKKKSSIPDEIMQEAADAAGQNKNLAPSYIAQEHHHNIVFKGHRLGGFKGASLNSQSGKFAKYWLLNAKETNGNGWGIAAHTAKENMKKFIGRPLVVTAKSWHGASEYGEEYEHPYLPTNDISAILNHQDKFRVGSIVDVFEDSNGDWFANIEMLPKFASRTLPPFCSPAIYQLDAKENEGQISKWEALHLAALNENPAYGARIALLKGTCIGTGNECKVQFKAAKLEGKVVCTKKLKGRVASLKKKQKIAGKRENDILNSALALREHGGVDASKFDTPLSEASKDTPQVTTGYRLFEQTGRGDKKAGGIALSNSFAKGRMRKLGKLKARLKLASLGEQNMTYQNSKKVKIIKKKHPEVRKAAEEGIEDILRKSGSSVDGSHAEASFMSSTGDFIGGNGSHLDQILKVTNQEHLKKNENYLDDGDDIMADFMGNNSLVRVQNFPINRAGQKVMNFDIRNKPNSTQLRSMKDSEIGGNEIGFSIGNGYADRQHGKGFRNLTKALREQSWE